MGDDYGQLSRAILSHDAVLVGALVDGLQASTSETSRCRCPINPAVFRPTLAPDSVPMQFAAATQVLLADQWVADKAAEGNRAAQLVRPFGRRAVRRAAEGLEALGAEPEQVIAFELEQLAVESGGATPAQAAAPTAGALAKVFSWAGRLPGTVDLDSGQAQALSDLGAAVGRVIYGIDALDDLAEDLQSGAFNPCIAGGRVAPQRRADCERMLAEGLDDIEEALAQVPWARGHALLHNVLVDRQGKRAREAVRKARTVAPDPLTLWQRLLAFLAPMLAFFGTRASGSGSGSGDDWGEVFDKKEADRKKRKKKKKKKGDGDGGGDWDGDAGGLDCCDGFYCFECGCDACSWSRRDNDCCDLDVPGPCDLDCCPCDGDGCGCEPDCCACDCG